MSLAFAGAVIGRVPDLRPQPDQCEWRLYGDPEVALRISTRPEAAGQGTLSLGVTDLAVERARLAPHWADLPDLATKPGVITLLRFADPDGNAVTLWQDLLGTRRPAVT